MKKIVLLSLLFVYFGKVSAQVISSKKWTDLFSYNNVLAIKDDGEKIICATENGIFFYKPSSGEITKLSKANGLHDVKISAFDYSATLKTGIVGYKNGSLDVISPEGITYVVDIPIAAGFNGNKNINHISITGDKAVISVNYGVSIFDLKKKEFGLTAFFNTGGIFQAAKESTIKDNKVYVGTDNGLKVHDLNVTFPVYSTWTNVLSGSIIHVDSDGVVSCSTKNQAYYENGNSFLPFSQAFNDIKDIVVNSQNIIVTDDQRVYVFGPTGSLVSSSTFAEECNTANLAIGQLYGGTKLSGLKDKGGLTYKPDGPYNNRSFKMSKLDDQLWVASGAIDSYNDPVPADLGYYHFDGSKWIYPSFFKDNPILFNVMDVIANPSKPSEVFFTNHSYTPGSKGIYKMDNNQFVKVYNNTDAASYLNRIIGLTFDENNQLFASVFALENSIFAMGYYVYNKTNDSFTLVPTANIGGAYRPIAKDGLLIIPSPYFGSGGLVIRKYGSNPTSTSSPTKVLNKDNNFPVNGMVSIALDTEGELWVGNREGLRIISNPDAAIPDPSYQAQPIIIEENGIGEELFRDNTVLEIDVDSGNRKWVSVDGGGVFYLSDTGEQTIKHFTKENSPLPNNSVTDILVDHKTGKVYFATLDGIVVYQGDAIDVTSNFGNVLVYPNPVVYSNFKGNVTIRGLAQKTNIRITDSAGNLVHQGVARGGFYEWDLNNQRGKRVASGVYFVLMTNEDGTDKATAKIAVVN